MESTRSFIYTRFSAVVLSFESAFVIKERRREMDRRGQFDGMCRRAAKNQRPAKNDLHRGELKFREIKVRGFRSIVDARVTQHLVQRLNLRSGIHMTNKPRSIPSLCPRISFFPLRWEDDRIIYSNEFLKGSKLYYRASDSSTCHW